jgi:hypothetical protein
MHTAGQLDPGSRSGTKLNSADNHQPAIDRFARDVIVTLHRGASSVAESDFNSALRNRFMSYSNRRRDLSAAINFAGTVFRITNFVNVQCI